VIIPVGGLRSWRRGGERRKRKGGKGSGGEGKVERVKERCEVKDLVLEVQ